MAKCGGGNKKGGKKGCKKCLFLTREYEPRETFSLGFILKYKI